MSYVSSQCIGRVLSSDFYLAISRFGLTGNARRIGDLPKQRSETRAGQRKKGVGSTKTDLLDAPEVQIFNFLLPPAVYKSGYTWLCFGAVCIPD